MSIVSSRVSSVSSILKGSGVRSALVNSQKRICFKLPRNLKTVLLNYENGCDRQAYQDMVCILRDSNVKVCLKYFHYFFKYTLYGFCMKVENEICLNKVIMMY